VLPEDFMIELFCRMDELPKRNLHIGVQSVSVLVSYLDGNKTEIMLAPAGSNIFSITFTVQWKANKVGTDSTQWW